MSTPPPCASCCNDHLPSVVSRSKRRRIRERNVVIRKATENTRKLVSAVPFLSNQVLTGLSGKSAACKVEESLLELERKVDTILHVLNALTCASVENQMSGADGLLNFLRMDVAGFCHMGEEPRGDIAYHATKYFESPDCIPGAFLEKQCQAARTIQKYMRSHVLGKPRQDRDDPKEAQDEEPYFAVMDAIETVVEKTWEADINAKPLVPCPIMGGRFVDGDVGATSKKRRVWNSKRRPADAQREVTRGIEYLQGPDVEWELSEEDSEDASSSLRAELYAMEDRMRNNFNAMCLESFSQSMGVKLENHRDDG